MTLTEAQLAQRRAAGLKGCRKGGKANAARNFTSEHQRLARSKVKRESLVASGRKGWQATFAKNPELAGRILADWRENNPSTPESIVDGWLSELGIVPAKEVPLGGLYLDRVVGSLAIEVDGAGLHNTNAPDADKRLANDRRKEALCFALGLTLIRLPEVEIKNGSARQTLMENLK